MKIPEEMTLWLNQRGDRWPSGRERKMVLVQRTDEVQIRVVSNELINRPPEEWELDRFVPWDAEDEALAGAR